MKIAIPTFNEQVYNHFGQTLIFTIVTLLDNEVIHTERLDVSMTESLGLIHLLEEHQIDVLLCGGIGDQAKRKLSEKNIALLSGLSGNVLDVIEQFKSGNIQPIPDYICEDQHTRCLNKVCK